MPDDYRLKRGFLRHRKTKRLARALGADAVLCLLQLWDFCSGHRTDGRLFGMAPDDIEAEADWHGEPGAFYRTCVELKWIDVTAKGPMVHQWDQHQPYLVGFGKRQKASAKANAFRWGKKVATPSPSSEPESGFVQTGLPLTLPSPPRMSSSPPGNQTSSSVEHAPFRQFTDHCVETWQGWHSGNPSKTWTKADWVALAAAFEALDSDLPKATAAWDRYLTATGKFFNGHTPRKFRSNLSEFLEPIEHESEPDMCDLCKSNPKVEGARLCVYCQEREDRLHARR